MNDRVHGDKILRRRLDEGMKKNEKRKALEEDFQGICGYCGKSSRIFLEKFETDHFAPQEKFKERREDYTNFVYSCPHCNRLKWDKWVTQDPFISHTETEGFIDPATEEFDKHIGRNENGDIYPKTEIGKYMCEVFQFDIRPIALIWKIMKLKQLRKELEEDNQKEGLEHYREITKLLDEYIEYIRFEKNE